MAKVTDGPFKGFSGTVDGITYSPQANGETYAKKKNGKRKVPASPLQEKMMSATKIYSPFIQALREFVNVGYAAEAKLLGLNPYNAMVKHTRKDAFPDQKNPLTIAFDKIMVTKGSLLLPDEYHVEMSETGLLYRWSTEVTDQRSHYSDQVMMLAYFPELKESHFLTCGRERRTGTDLLDLRGIKRGYTAEVYLSFTSNDHKQIANSVYVGQFNW